jgi:hypothetical protein
VGWTGTIHRTLVGKSPRERPLGKWRMGLAQDCVSARFDRPINEAGTV